MKKIIIIMAFSALLSSCSVDTSENLDNSENLTTAVLNADDSSSTGTYKGVFTTNDSQLRATVEVKIPRAYSFTKETRPIATFKFTDNTMRTVYGELQSYKGGVIDKVAFESDNLNFEFSVSGDGTNPLIENVIFENTASSILIKKETSRAPLSPITGTFACVECNNHPVLNTGMDQTFSFVVTDNPTGDDIISIQLIAGGNQYIGAGLQTDCAENAVLTTCNDLNGVVTLPGSTTASFNGTHTFNNEATSEGNDCSQVTGNWTWVTENFGTISGNFNSDDSCTDEVVLIDEGFEDENNLSYEFGPVTPAFPGQTASYFRITDGTDISATINNIQGSNFFGAQWTRNQDVSIPVLFFDAIDITNLNNFTLSAYFAEDTADDGNEDWDDFTNIFDDFVYIEYRFGIDGTDHLALAVIADEDTVNEDGRDGAPRLVRVGDNGTSILSSHLITDVLTEYNVDFENNTTTNPTGSNELYISVSITVTNFDEDIAIDNIKLTGN